MKTKAFLLVTISSLLFHPSIFAQGSLTPPGPPAPTMKTLDEIEPRINIQRTINPLPTDANYHYIISAAGSYYLTANLGATKTNAIHVTAAGVTIDLNGFQIQRTSGSGGEGITIDAAAHRCTVKDGSVNGFAFGVHCPPTDGEVAHGGAFLGLAASGNSQWGLFAGFGWRIEGCQAHDNPGSGILAEKGSTLTNCTVSNNTPGNSGYGIFANAGCVLKNCTASTNTTYAAIAATDGSTLSDCTASQNIGTHGIVTGLGVALVNCVAAGNQGTYGFYLDAGSTLTNGIASANQGTSGIHLVSGGVLTNCSASGNTSSAASSSGISTGPSCTITGCAATNTANTNATASPSTGVGIAVSYGCTIKGTTSRVNKGDGIQLSFDSTVADCTVEGNQARGISGTNRNLVANCNVSSNNQAGIAGTDGWTIRASNISNNCNVAGPNSAGGIVLNDSSDISGCTLLTNKTDGIKVNSSNTIEHDVSNTNGSGAVGYGIHATGFGNRIDSNEVRNSLAGGIKLDVNNAHNVVIRNTLGNNTGGNYLVGTGNGVGPIISSDAGNVGSATNSPMTNIQD